MLLFYPPLGRNHGKPQNNNKSSEKTGGRKWLNKTSSAPFSASISRSGFVFAAIFSAHPRLFECVGVRWGIFLMVAPGFVFPPPSCVAAVLPPGGHSDCGDFLRAPHLRALRPSLEAPPSGLLDVLCEKPAFLSLRLGLLPPVRFCGEGCCRRNAAVLQSTGGEWASDVRLYPTALLTLLMAVIYCVLFTKMFKRRTKK